LIPHFGIIGTAMSNTISVILMYSIALIAVRVKMKLWPYDIHYLKGVVSIGFAGFCTLIVKLLLANSSLIGLIIQFSIMVSAFIFSLYLLGLTREDQAFLVIILRRLGIKKEVFAADISDVRKKY